MIDLIMNFKKYVALSSIMEWLIMSIITTQTCQAPLECTIKLIMPYERTEQTLTDAHHLCALIFSPSEWEVERR